MHRRTVSFPSNYRATRDKKGGLSFIASTSTPARDNILLEQDWRLDHFRANPVFLFEHNSHPLLSGLPIGAVQRIATKNSQEFGRHLRASVVFVPEDLYPFARQVEKFYEEGFLSAVSVGFDAARMRMATLEEMRSHGLSENDFLIVGEEPELFELSAAVVPVDTNALKERGINLSTPEAAMETFLKGADKKGIVQFTEQKRSELRASLEEQRNGRRKGVIAAMSHNPSAPAQPSAAVANGVRSAGGGGEPSTLARVEGLLQEVLHRLPVAETRAASADAEEDEDDDLLDLPEPGDDEDDEDDDLDDEMDDLDDEDESDDEADEADEETEDSLEESEDDSEEFPAPFAEDSSEESEESTEEVIDDVPDEDEFGDPIEAQADEPDDSSGGDDEESEIDEQLGAAIGAVEELLGST